MEPTRRKLAEIELARINLENCFIAQIYLNFIKFPKNYYFKMLVNNFAFQINPGSYSIINQTQTHLVEYPKVKPQAV